MKRIFGLLLAVAAALMLVGCSITTSEQLYSLPKRSEDYNNLQSAIDRAMTGLEYCAPLTGENQQTVQMADLDGDGAQEYLVFAKGSAEKPLHILVFDEVDGTFQNVDVLESNGTAFEQVEYVAMDNKEGVELVVGRQISDQLTRSVSVYTFSGGEAEQLLNTNYTKFVTVDLDMDSKTEVFVLRPGQTDTDNGVAEVFGIENGIMERSNEVSTSGPVDQLKRILVGQLHDEKAAVYTASAVSDTALVTDVYAYVDGHLVNVSFSNESGTSVKTLRNYYVYADDIDNDGVVELPSLIPMQSVEDRASALRQNIIRWYAMKSDGSEVDKMFTYHEFVGGWYLELGSDWASRLTVEQSGNNYAFLVWDESYQKTEEIVTIFALTGQNREEEAHKDGRFVLMKTDTVTYAARLGAAADYYHMDQESMIRNFRLVQHDWKTGEA